MRKHIKSFASELEYENLSTPMNVPNIVFIKENEGLKYNPLPAFAGIILYEDADGNMKRTADILNSDSGYTPIGIEITPYNFFGDGSGARYMSLKGMSADDPDNGHTEFTGAINGLACHGVGQYPFSALPYYDTPLNGSDVKYFTNDVLYSSTSGSYIVDKSLYKYIGEYPPYGHLSVGSPYTYSYISLYDKKGHWNSKPYVYDDGIKGNQYEMSGGALGDINGKTNTATMLEEYTAEDYKTVETLTNTGNPNYFTAAGACWRYHTKGTSQGDWYLGAAGEMVFVVANAGKINYILSQLNNAGHTVLSKLPADYNIWTSTCYGENLVCNVYSSLKVCYASIQYGAGPDKIPTLALLQI